MKHLILMLAIFTCLTLVGTWIDSNYVFKTTPTSYDSSKGYKADLVIHELAISDVSPAGFSATFKTEKNQALVVEWTVYPSDMFMSGYCGDGQYHSFAINTFPEGGTVIYRITDGNDWFLAHGTEWRYQDLPRSTDPNAILPPPYMQTEKEVTK